MARTDGYKELGQLVEEFTDLLQSMAYQPLIHSDQPMQVGLMQYGDKVTSINQRFDIPLVYNGNNYYITIRRRNR